MPIGASPFRPKSRGAMSIARTPSPPPLPPKPPSAPRTVIDLNSSTGSFDRSSDSRVARRAVLCDLVVEHQGEETNYLLNQLGNPLEPSVIKQANYTLPPLTQASSAENDRSSWDPSKRDEMERRLQQLTEEMVRTERSYVSRIEALQKYYAAPLRFFAKQGNTVIIPKYHAKTLFGNIDAVLPAAQTFLRDLEELWATGQASTQLGDLCLRHLKTLRTLEPYGTYIGNQDEAQKIFQDLYRNDKSFEKFVDTTKMQTTGIGNIGLRELLMEPVQRIPRYTMLWQSMAKCMPPLSEHRSKLLESIDIVSRIARCEADEQTVRATVMYCLQRNIDGIPASIFSNHRNFIDSIDVEELFGEASLGGGRATPRALKTATGTPTEGPSILHCTLFLFDDQLIIAKRPSSTVSGRKMTGLDDIAKLVKSGGGVAVKEKDGTKKERLSFRGAIDILKLSGMDLGGGDFQLMFEGHSRATPLFADQSERWAGRPLRSYSTIQPPLPVGHDPQQCRSDKNRFLENLWAAQALCRTHPRHKMVEPVCRALVSEEDVDLHSELMRVKLYWNLWDRSSWTTTERKISIVIQVTEDEDAQELRLPQEGGPALVIRLDVMPGAVCRLQAVTNTGSPVFRTATSIAEVNDKIVEAITAADLLKVQLPRTSTSTTNTAQFSKRASRFGSDIARNLWGNTASSRGASSDTLGGASTRTSHTSFKSRSLDVAAKSSDMLSISSVSTGGPKTPKSDRSPVSPSSPVSFTEALSQPGHGLGVPSDIEEPFAKEPQTPSRSKSPVAKPLLSPIKQHTPLKLTSSPFKSPQKDNATRQGASGSQPIVTSHVAAMRQEFERKMNDSSLETLTTPRSSPAVRKSPSPSPSPRPPTGMRNRLPVSTLAASVFQQECRGLSRDSSVTSLPASPTRNDSLSRSNTMSPRGPRPRGPAARGGYVPPLPPPSVTSLARNTPLPPSAPGSTLSQEISRQPSLASRVHSMGVQSADHTSLMSNSGHSAPSNGHHIDLGSDVQNVESLPEEQAVDEAQAGTRTNGHGIGLGAPPRRANDENIPPERIVSQKRSNEIDDQSSPRKRSSSNSSSIVARVGSEGPGCAKLSAAAPRRSSTKVSSRKPPSAMATRRQVSALSTTSLHTLETAIDDTDIVMSDHPDILSASDSARHHIADARKLSRRIRMDAATIRKICSPAGTGAPGGLSRSPSVSELGPRPNIHATLMDPRQDMARADMRDMDELARHIQSAGEKLEDQCIASLADSERVRMLARQVHEGNEAYEGTISTLEAQVERAKEREALLADQLRRRDLELEEIYNAFNAELDGMYSDVTLPRPDAAGAALRRDLQATKAARNALDLENKRLKLELEEEKLLREQWSQLLQARGLLR